MPIEGQQQGIQTQAEAQVPVSLVDRIVDEGRLGQSDVERQQGKQWVQAFLDEIMQSQIVVSKDLEHMLSERIAQVDELLSGQLNEVMHAPELQKLESELITDLQKCDKELKRRERHAASACPVLEQVTTR